MYLLLINLYIFQILLYLKLQFEKYSKIQFYNMVCTNIYSLMKIPNTLVQLYKHIKIDELYSINRCMSCLNIQIMQIIHSYNVKIL